MFEGTGGDKRDYFAEEMYSLRPFLFFIGLKRFTQDEALVKDLVQATFERALRYRDTFESGTSMKNWLARILTNEFRTVTEGARREKRALAAYARLVNAEEERRDMQLPEAEAYVLLSQALRLVRKLPKDQEEALLIVGVGGYSYERAAKILGIEIGTVRSRVSRARAEIRHLMENPFKKLAEAPPLPPPAVHTVSTSMKLDPENRAVIYGGRVIHFREKEFRLLSALARAGKPLSRRYLLTILYSHGASELDLEMVDMFVSRIRSKLEEAEPQLSRAIQTYPHNHYRFFQVTL